MMYIIKGGIFLPILGGDWLEKHVLSVLVKNSSGVLTRVSSLFSRRGYNIESLTVGQTENHENSRMTITLFTDEDMLQQVKKQLAKLEDVINVVNFKPKDSVCRELVLIKVKATKENRSEINETVNIFRSKIVDISNSTMTIELTGNESKVSAFINLMKEIGIIELARTGVTALQRGNETIDKDTI